MKNYKITREQLLEWLFELTGWDGMHEVFVKITKEEYTKNFEDFSEHSYMLYDYYSDYIMDSEYDKLALKCKDNEIIVLNNVPATDTKIYKFLKNEIDEGLDNDDEFETDIKCYNLRLLQKILRNY